MKSPRNVFKDSTYKLGQKELSDHQIDRLDIPDHKVRQAGILRLGRNALALTLVTAASAGSAIEVAHHTASAVNEGVHDAAALFDKSLDAQHQMDLGLRKTAAEQSTLPEYQIPVVNSEGQPQVIPSQEPPVK